MMTVTAIVAGLLPILWNDGTGSEVMQRIAVPMIGGMASSALDLAGDSGNLRAGERVALGTGSQATGSVAASA